MLVGFRTESAALKIVPAPKEKADLRNSGGASRREFLVGLAALGGAAVIPEAGLAEQMGNAAATGPFRIDTHYHFTVPKLAAESAARGITQAGLQDWTPQKSLEQMDKGGVATSILSMARCAKSNMPSISSRPMAHAYFRVTEANTSAIPRSLR